MLGPLLFLIYINDLPNCSDIIEFFLFADDTHLFYDSDSNGNLEKVFNKELKKLSTWLIVNRLSLNLTKTNFVIFHSLNKNVSKNITLKIDKKAIAVKNDVKYLGIFIDSLLTWRAHIDKLTKSTSRVLGVLYRIRSCVDVGILKTLYYALIYPHLSYAIEVWGSADKSHLDKLLKLQKRIVRMITISDRRQDDHSFPPSNPLFKQLGFLKI